MCWNISSAEHLAAPLEPVRSLWVGGVLPAANRACIASFLRVGHPFALFVYDAVEGFPAGTRLRRADQIVPRERVFRYGPAAGRGEGGLSGFSNLFRYALLLREGGYWVDTDVFCLRPFPTGEVIVASERGRNGRPMPTSCVLRCPAGSTFARYCYERSLKANPATLMHGQIGPALVASAVRQPDFTGVVVSPDVFCGVNWYDHTSLCGCGALAPGASGVHLWAEMWRRWNGEIPWPGPPGSALHQLAGMVEGEVGVA